MWSNIPLTPDQASTIASSVDHLYFLLTAISVFFSVIIFAAIFFFVIKYRRRSDDERPAEIEGSLPLEITWTVIPTLITVALFLWSSSLYFRNARPPRSSVEVFAIGKQWMWHLQHPEGAREINELHVPVNVPIKVTMTSEDVIHDFYIPAFRVKKDALPGRYTSIWFEADKTGDFHLFCAQYCGMEHSAMIGWIHVMEPGDYAAWLAGTSSGETMEKRGEVLFTQLGCAVCHQPDGKGRGPSLVKVFGSQVKLNDGRTVIADEPYLRGSILVPYKETVAGYTAIMPTFQGQVSEEQVLELIAYIKSLGAQQQSSTGSTQP